MEAEQAAKIAWSDKLTLNDGEVDFDLVQPSTVVWRMNQNDIAPFGIGASLGSPATMEYVQALARGEHPQCADEPAWWLSRLRRAGEAESYPPGAAGWVIVYPWGRCVTPDTSGSRDLRHLVKTVATTALVAASAPF